MEYNLLLSELGKKLSGMTLTPDSGGAVSLEVDGLSVTLLGLEEVGLIVLSGLVGEPPPEAGMEKLYRAMLEANHAFAGTSGATLAIRPDDGCVELCQTLELATLDLDRLYGALEKFVNVLELWHRLVTDFRGNIEGAARGETPPQMSESPRFGDAGFLKI